MIEGVLFEFHKLIMKRTQVLELLNVLNYVHVNRSIYSSFELIYVLHIQRASSKFTARIVILIIWLYIVQFFAFRYIIQARLPVILCKFSCLYHTAKGSRS